MSCRIVLVARSRPTCSDCSQAFARCAASLFLIIFDLLTQVRIAPSNFKEAPAASKISASRLRRKTLAASALPTSIKSKCGWLARGRVQGSGSTF